MTSENGVLVDMSEVGAVVEMADVFLIAFSTFSDRLLVDTRSDATNGPLVSVVKQVNSYRERMSWLKKQRPGLGLPEGFSFLNWPHSVAFLVESGAWEKIRERVGTDIDPEIDEACGKAMARMTLLERQAHFDATSGHRYVTLWPRED